MPKEAANKISEDGQKELKELSDRTYLSTEESFSFVEGYADAPTTSPSSSSSSKQAPATYVPIKSRSKSGSQ